MKRKKSKYKSQNGFGIASTGSKEPQKFRTIAIPLICAILSAIVTVFVTKACNRIMPDNPIVVEKVSDTIQVVHTYNPLSDSAWTEFKKQSEEMVDVNVIQQKKNSYSLSKSNNISKVFTSARFPNSKGYTSRSAAQYFVLEMSPLNLPYVDFTINFFNEELLSEIYCLSIKICKIRDGKREAVLDENYEKRQSVENVIRLKNIFNTSDKYEIAVGFFFLKDIEEKYPDFYMDTIYINNSQMKH